VLIIYQRVQLPLPDTTKFRTQGTQVSNIDQTEFDALIHVDS